jgi:FAD/FMN-containing dehydrogenase
MNDIPEEALKGLEERFGTRFVAHAPGEAEPPAEQPFASVFPESAEEVESLVKLAACHSIPLVARGAGHIASSRTVATSCFQPARHLALRAAAPSQPS